MYSLKLKLDTKKIENQLNEIVKNKQKEIIINQSKGDGMYILNSNEEKMLDVFIDKYDKNKKYEMSGYINDFPEYMHFSIKDTMTTLKYAGLLSNFDLFMSGGWHAIITPDALKYYAKKGSRIELFYELAKSDKELLLELIEAEKDKKDLSDLLKEKIEKDDTETICDVLENLKSNGLIKTMWADDTIYYATLTQQGRTFFEREKDYEEKMKKANIQNVLNIETINAPNGNVIIGDVNDSNIIINNTLSKIENDIEEKCNNSEEKEELNILLEEVKEIIENYKETKQFTTRKSFFRKLTEHLDKHGWFYAEITSLLGQAALMKISGQI